MRRKRTIYFNDARHFYLFVFEPPMTLQDAWRPIDECAATGVDTFIYGVSRDDGLFYPSKVGQRFQNGEHGDDAPGFRQAAYWRLYNNMQSLIDRGLDPLSVLIDRAHEKGMDFFASLRLGGYKGMDPTHAVANGGGNFVHEEVRDYHLAVLGELVTDYPVEGVELDFAAGSGGSAPLLQPDEAREHTALMTNWIAQVAAMARTRPGEPALVGARVFPTEEMNLAIGLDVSAMLREGLLDYVTPMIYNYNLVDPNMPIDWLIEAAHRSKAAVYPMVQAYYQLEGARRFHGLEHAAPAMMRAAAANYWDKGADGLYTWFLKWPLGDVERSILSQLSDPDQLVEADKHYVVNRSSGATVASGYSTSLPLDIEADDVGTRRPVRFYIADDVAASADRIRQVLLKIRIKDLVSADRLSFFLNGESLAPETLLRDYGEFTAPYDWMWLEFHLETVRPCKGENLLEIELQARAHGLISPLRVEDVEIIIEYGSFPSSTPHRDH